MPNYQELYHILFQATEQAARILIAAQQKCEELYVNSPAENLSVFPACAPEKRDPDQ